MLRKRTLLLAIVALLCAAALFAIVILLVGRFGRTELRVLQTTTILAGYGVLAIPAALLSEQRRGRRTTVAAAAATAAGALTAIAAVWSPGSTTGRIAATALFVALFATQWSALLARRRPDDPRTVARLFAGSLVTGAALVTMMIGLVWAEIDSAAYGRAVGVVLVLDVLLVALQPLLARLRPPADSYRLRLTFDNDEAQIREVEGADLASAAARAIRDAERRGEHVRGIDVEHPEPRGGTRTLVRPR